MKRRRVLVIFFVALTAAGGVVAFESAKTGRSSSAPTVTFATVSAAKLALNGVTLSPPQSSVSATVADGQTAAAATVDRSHECARPIDQEPAVPASRPIDRMEPGWTP